MAGVRIEITARGLDDVQLCIDDLARRGRDLTPFFNGVGRALLRSTRARFDARAGPDGTPGRRCSEATKARKRKNKDKILVHEGDLKESSLSFKADRDSLKLGSDKIYAGTRQFGRPPPRRSGRAEGEVEQDDDPRQGEERQEEDEDGLEKRAHGDLGYNGEGRKSMAEFVFPDEGERFFDRAAANVGLTFTCGAGCMAGPIVSGAAPEAWPPHGVTPAVAARAAAFALWTAAGRREDLDKRGRIR